MSKRLMTAAMTVAIGIGGATAAAGQDPQQPEQRQTEPRQSDKAQTKGVASGSINNNDQRFIREAAEGGKAEVALGNLALQKASSEEVKQFAQRMVDDHSKANQELTELATQKGVSLQPGTAARSSTAAGAVREGMTTDPRSTTSSATQSGRAAVTGAADAAAGELTGKHKQLYDRLSRLSGAEFDREYMKEMVKDHNKDVAAFEKASEKSQDADLKAWAAKTLPTLREHQQQARDISAKVDTKSSDKSSQPTRNP